MSPPSTARRPEGDRALRHRRQERARAGRARRDGAQPRHIEVAVDRAEVEEDRRLEQRLRRRLLEPAAEALLPPGDPAEPLRRHVATRAAREASGHEIGDRLLGERGEVLARAGHVLAPDERVVLVREDHLLHPPLGAEHEPRIRRRRRAEVRLGPAQDPGDEGVVEPRDEAADHRRLEAAVEERGGHLDDLLRVAGKGVAPAEPLDALHHRDRPRGRALQEVGRGEDADDRAVAGDGKVMAARVEQDAPGLVDRAVGRDGLERRAVDLEHRCLRPAPRREDATAEVAVGDDAGWLGVDEHGRHRAVGHEPRRLAYLRVLRDPDRWAAQERRDGHREVRLEAHHLRALERVPEPLGEPGREVPGERALREERLELLLRQPVGEEVLLDGHVDRGLAGDERGEPEDLALLEHLERLGIALEPHRALADDVEVLRRLTPADEEARLRRMEHDLERLRGVLEDGEGEGVERGGAPNERDRIQRDHSLGEYQGRPRRPNDTEPDMRRTPLALLAVLTLAAPAAARANTAPGSGWSFTLSAWAGASRYDVLGLDLPGTPFARWDLVKKQIEAQPSTGGTTSRTYYEAGGSTFGVVGGIGIEI